MIKVLNEKEARNKFQSLKEEEELRQEGNGIKYMDICSVCGALIEATDNDFLIEESIMFLGDKKYVKCPICRNRIDFIYMKGIGKKQNPITLQWEWESYHENGE